MNFIEQQQIVRVVHCKEQLQNSTLQMLSWYKTEKNSKRRVFENEILKLSVGFVPENNERPDEQNEQIQNRRFFVIYYGESLFHHVHNNYPKLNELKYYTYNTPLIWKDRDCDMESLKSWDWRMRSFAGRKIDLCPIEGSFKNPRRIRLITTTEDMEELHEEYKLVKFPPLPGRVHQQFLYILDARQGVPLNEHEDRDRVDLCHVLQQLLHCSVERNLKNNSYRIFEPLQVQRPDRPWHPEKDFVFEWCHEPLKIECSYNKKNNSVYGFNVHPHSYFNLVEWLNKRLQLRQENSVLFSDETNSGNDLLKGHPVALSFCTHNNYVYNDHTLFNVRLVHQNNDIKRMYYGDECPALGYEYIISYNGIEIVGEFTFVTPQMDSVVTITTANFNRSSLNVLLEGMEHDTDYGFFNVVADESTEVVEGKYNIFKQYVQPNKELLGAAGAAIKQLKKYYGFGTARLPRYSLHVYADDYESADDELDSVIDSDDDMVF